MKKSYLVGVLITAGLFLNACENTIEVKESEPSPTAETSPAPSPAAGSDSTSTSTAQPAPAPAASPSSPSTPPAADTSSSGSTQSSTTPAPAGMQDLLNSVCNPEAPTPAEIRSVVNGESITYQEVLAQEDKSGEISDGSSLFAQNRSGLLYVEPSTDGKVSWAIKKWTLAQTQQLATDSLAEITVASDTQNGESRVIIDYPNDRLPGVRYRSCAVVRAPAGWAHTLRNSSGDIESVAHVGPIDIETSSGAVFTSQQGSGAIAIRTSSGNITLEADSTAAVTLSATSGRVQYTLLNGNLPLQAASSITTSSGQVDTRVQTPVGLRLDIQTTSGQITVPEGLPAPERIDFTNRLAADLNGGGATLTIRASSGRVDVSQFN